MEIGSEKVLAVQSYTHNAMGLKELVETTYKYPEDASALKKLFERQGLIHRGEPRYVILSLEYIPKKQKAYYAEYDAFFQKMLVLYFTNPVETHATGHSRIAIRKIFNYGFHEEQILSILRTNELVDDQNGKLIKSMEDIQDDTDYFAEYRVQPKDTPIIAGAKILGISFGGTTVYRYIDTLTNKKVFLQDLYDQIAAQVLVPESGRFFVCLVTEGTLENVKLCDALFNKRYGSLSLSFRIHANSKTDFMEKNKILSITGRTDIYQLLDKFTVYIEKTYEDALESTIENYDTVYEALESLIGNTTLVRVNIGLVGIDTGAGGRKLKRRRSPRSRSRFLRKKSRSASHKSRARKLRRNKTRSKSQHRRRTG